MTMLPSKRFEIWRMLAARLLLEDSPPGGIGALVSTMIQPVVDVSALLRTFEQIQVNVTSIAAGFVSMHTVPQGERWTVYRQYLTRSAGDRAVDNFRIQSDGVNLSFDPFTAATSFATPGNEQPFTIENGAILQVQFSGGTTDGTWVCRALISRELI